MNATSFGGFDAGGVPEISRWSSASETTGTRADDKVRTPEGNAVKDS